MAGAPHDFDDAFDDDERGPLLPPEDRIWRHPSEMNGVVAEARAARDRWLSSTPTRAGAWSAGLVGAVLATGVVLVGTHVTNWLGTSAPRPAITTAAVSTTVAPEEMCQVVPSLTAKICNMVHESLTVVAVGTQRGTSTGDGVVLASDGMILVPLSLLAGAPATPAIKVTTADGQCYAGRVRGTDATTGLAVVSIGTDSPLTPLSAATDPDISTNQWLAVEWSSLHPANSLFSMDSVLSIGAVSSHTATSATPGSVKLLDDLRVQAIGLSGSPLGTVLLNSKGQLLGMIVSRDDGKVVETPGDLAEAVGDEIIANGRVSHGWLGIQGRSAHAFASTEPSTSKDPDATPAPPLGVEVTAVGTHTSAAFAGLRAGDVIEAVNGRSVDSMEQLQAVLYIMMPHAAVRLTVDRGTSIRTLETRLQAAA